MKKALIAMSGGVDSSVAAYIAVEQGYLCGGAMMHLWSENGVVDSRDAESVAQKLKIPFHIFEAKTDFCKNVVEPFISDYENGLTPNPCIRCNRTLKFGFFADEGKKLGYDYTVTGHYARIRFDEASGRYLLYKALDSSKDQSYFLAFMTQKQLSSTLFPLGELTKEQVRQIAQEQGFINAQKKDSQDICFVPDGDYKAFMQRYTGKLYPCGNFLDLNGTIVGTHQGAVGYTLGQRKGLGLAMGEPVYVCGKDMRANTVTVGKESHLFTSTLYARDCVFIPFEQLNAPMEVTVKARSRHKEQPATVYPMENGEIKVVFEQPQRAITPGQAVVLYQGDLVIGAGIIQ